MFKGLFSKKKVVKEESPKVIEDTAKSVETTEERSARLYFDMTGKKKEDIRS